MGLIQLIYISTKQPTQPGEIFRIQEQAQRNNAVHDITGVLLFNREYFLQCLEGEREPVTSRFITIAADERHSHISLLHVDDVTERSYPDWSMGLLDASSASLRAVLDDVLPGGLLMPDNLTTGTTRVIMQRMRTLHLTR